MKLAVLLALAGFSFVKAIQAQTPAPPPAPATAPATPPKDAGLDVTVVGPKVTVAEPDKPEPEAPHAIGVPANAGSANVAPAKATVGAPGVNPPGGAASSPDPTKPSGTASSAAAIDAGPRYVLGPNDVVQIQVYKEPLTGMYPIGPDGMMSMPLINEFKASGLTLMGLKELITKKLGEFINEPEVSVGLARSNSKKYTLVGGVMRTGPIPLVSETTILDALSAAGFKEFANKKKIVLQRGDKRIPFNYNQVIKGQNMQQNITLQDGDIIYVPE